MALPFTRQQLEASLVAIDGLMVQVIAGGNALESYTLPTGVTVSSATKVSDLVTMADYYRKLLRSYYPTMGLSRGY